MIAKDHYDGGAEFGHEVAKAAENFEMKAKEYEMTKSVIRIVRSH